MGKKSDDLLIRDVPLLLEEYKELAAVLHSLQQAYHAPLSLLAGKSMALSPEELPSVEEAQNMIVSQFEFK